MQVHTNGSHQNGKRGSHVSTVSIYRQEEPAMSGAMTGDEPEPGIGMCGWLLTSISWFVVIITLPFSLCVCFKVSPGGWSLGTGTIMCNIRLSS